MRPKSTSASSSTVVDSMICPSDASLVRTSTTAPEGTVSTGGIVALQRLCVFSEPRVKSGVGAGSAVSSGMGWTVHEARTRGMTRASAVRCVAASLRLVGRRDGRTGAVSADACDFGVTNIMMTPFSGDEAATYAGSPFSTSAKRSISAVVL